MAKSKQKPRSGELPEVVACDGASNLGEMTHEAAKTLHSEASAKFFSLASVGAEAPGAVNGLLETDHVLVLDGCPTCCGKQCVDKARLSGYSHLVMTELGVEKTNDFEWTQEEMESALDAARSMLEAGPGQDVDAGGRLDADEDAPMLSDAGT